VLLIALWVRSYKSFDRTSGRFAGRTSIILVSYAGRLSAVNTDATTLQWNWPKLDSGPILPHNVAFGDETFSWSDTDVMWPQHTRLGFGWIYRVLYPNIPNGEIGWNPQGMSGRSWAAGATGLIVPDWFGVLIFLALASIPWIRSSIQFSLRTLLIATTLVAVLMGLIVWLNHR
jgi:hypothetical protein